MPDNRLVDWLLTCVTGKGASLRDIIAYVDYRNHAILTYDEFTDALKQLHDERVLQRRGPVLQLFGKNSVQAEIPLYSREEFNLAVNEYLSKSQ